MEKQLRSILIEAVTPLFWEFEGEPVEWLHEGEPLNWVVGAVTQHVANRIDWGNSPQGAPYPRLVLNVISDAEGLVMNGPNGLSEGRVQIDAYADTYKDAKALSRAVIGVLHGLRNTNFRLVQHVSTRDSREGGTNEADRPFRVSLDFTVAWRAT